MSLIDRSANWPPPKYHKKARTFLPNLMVSQINNLNEPTIIIVQTSFVLTNLWGFLLKGLDAAQSRVVFNLFRDEVDWHTAKSECEAHGQRLAVLDTEEKRSALQAQNV